MSALRWCVSGEVRVNTYVIPINTYVIRRQNVAAALGVANQVVWDLEQRRNLQEYCVSEKFSRICKGVLRDDVLFPRKDGVFRPENKLPTGQRPVTLTAASLIRRGLLPRPRGTFETVASAGPRLSCLFLGVRGGAVQARAR